MVSAIRPDNLGAELQLPSKARQAGAISLMHGSKQLHEVHACSQNSLKDFSEFYARFSCRIGESNTESVILGTI